jgi:hypothetical protein
MPSCTCLLHPPPSQTPRGSKAFREYTPFDWAVLFLPCLRWLRTYKVKEWLLVRRLLLLFWGLQGLPGCMG